MFPANPHQIFAVGGLIDYYVKLVAGDVNLSAKFSHSIA